jgi:hypothetical protein
VAQPHPGVGIGARRPRAVQLRAFEVL